jgi:hypothetical protein
MIIIKRIKPNPPLGQYPQPELYGQAGSAPIKRRIRIINKIVPIASPFLNYFAVASYVGRRDLGKALPRSMSPTCEILKSAITIGSAKFPLLTWARKWF